MRITVLGSGSRGNAIAVVARGTLVLVDAGFGPRALVRRARAAGVALERLAAIVLTHEHADHARGARAAARRAGCPVFASRGTLRALGARLRGVEARALPARGALRLGPLRVTAARTSHDAAEPVALAVRGPTPGARVGVAYDLGRPTPGVRALLEQAACLLVEANHDDALLRTGPYPPVVQRRIAGPGGHLSNRAAARLVGQLWHPGLRTVVLTHLSAQCNRPELAVWEMRAALAGRGYRGQILVARQAGPLAPFDVEPPAQLSLAGLG